MSSSEVKVPDIGDFKNVPVIEVHVKPGQTVKAEDPLVTLESDKAAMDVPAPQDGIVEAVTVKVGDKVSEGTLIARFAAASASKPAEAKPAARVPSAQTGEPSAAPAQTRPSPRPASTLEPMPEPLPIPREVPAPPLHDFAGVHASPAVRRLARELDVDLTALKGTGEHGRITKDDVKRALAKDSGGAGGGGTGIPEIPPQDFAKFGPIETKPLSRMKRLSGPHLHRAWLNIPHVTHNDEADITDLDSYRKTLDNAAKAKGFRVTLLVFLMKASVVALKEFPEFNASLSPGKDALIYKKYYNIGVAVDTPDGLVVPVIKDVDRKGVLELSQELSAVSAKMRDGKIAPADIQGGTFSISSLGGIGGTAFTPIVNAPEVAILGVVRSAIRPKWDGATFEPRLMLPLCLSYDHRVIDGALAARFTRRLADVLEDVRQLVL
ncbi:MAG: dihydrolipoyllysine-residue acetyltransferase [Hyphomicrobium sp.]|nr:dihydrolipoyllysine-residue acetyltransferase [Hyphomicrobium sp.]